MYICIYIHTSKSYIRPQHGNAASHQPMSISIIYFYLSQPLLQQHETRTVCFRQLNATHQIHRQVQAFLQVTGAIADFHTLHRETMGNATYCCQYQATLAQGVGIAFTKPQLSIFPSHYVNVFLWGT